MYRTKNHAHTQRWKAAQHIQRRIVEKRISKKKILKKKQNETKQNRKKNVTTKKNEQGSPLVPPYTHASNATGTYT